MLVTYHLIKIIQLFVFLLSVSTLVFGFKAASQSTLFLSTLSRTNFQLEFSEFSALALLVSILKLRKSFLSFNFPAILVVFPT